MERIFFTYWIARYGKESFRQLTNKVCHKLRISKAILKKVDIDQYLFNYFAIVYFVVALDYFKVSVDKICFLLDLAFVPGTCKLFSPAEILKVQKDNIPEIIKYVEKDLKIYKKL